jgi:hypothetical protein
MREIQKGEEITLTYAHGLNYEQRAKMLKKWFPRCDCSLCGDDRDNGAASRGERTALLKRLNVPGLTVGQLRDIGKRIDSTYSSEYGWYRTESAEAHLALSQALEEVVMDNIQNKNSMPRMLLLLKESIQAGFKSLEGFGVEAVDKNMDPVPVGQDIALPISTARVPYDTSNCVLLCLVSVARFCVLGNQSRAEMWMRAALWSKSVLCACHSLG